MCGIFGTIRPRRYPTALRRASAQALLDLGAAAEERGIDSSGLAIFDGHGHTATRRDTTSPLVDLLDGRWRQILSLTAFSEDLPQWPRVRTDLAAGTIILGHTRWATQGAQSLRNASPLRLGLIVGTHNGDVAVPAGYPAERTDTAFLYRQLSKATNPAQITAVLAALRGRAALAWSRIDEPGYVHLARAALSPIWTAADTAGALWWASNPQWLREVSDMHQLPLTEPEPLCEGSYLRLRSDRTTVNISAERDFTPTCRAQDERIAAHAAWRGFDEADRWTEVAISEHRVLAEGRRWA